MKKSVDEIKHLCASCGVCAGMCKYIEMEDDLFGLYRPMVKEGCIKCGRCVSVCPEIIPYEEADIPFSADSGFKYDSNTGFYLSCYDGYVENHRHDCASGGMCSELLVMLLKRNIVDAIYCAVSHEDSHKLYTLSRVTTEEEIRRNARSAYYPIEISEALDTIRKLDESVAIVCLPCQAKALRLAMKQDLKLNNCIKYIIGLVCGGLPGKAMVEYIAKTNRVDINEIKRITFREKDEDIKCNNCQIKLYDRTGELRVTSRFHGESFGFAYLNKLFYNESCWVCDDAFAEYADVVFGDAWYKENTPNDLGTSICLTRNLEIDKLIRTMGKSIQSVDVEKIIDAQRNVGVIEKKKRQSIGFADVYRNKGYEVSNHIENMLDFKTKIKCRLYILFYNHDKKLWERYKTNNISFSKLDKKYHRSVKLRKRMHL